MEKSYIFDEHLKAARNRNQYIFQAKFDQIIAEIFTAGYDACKAELKAEIEAMESLKKKSKVKR